MRSLNRIAGVLLIGAAVLAPVGFAMAADSPADIIKTRHDHMKNDIGAPTKAIADQLKTGMPDKAIVNESAKKLASFAKQIPQWFPKGSGPESGVKTLAKAEIWAMPAEFKAAAEKLIVESDKLVQVAATGDAAALGDQMKATGGACQGCHKPFREPPPQ